MQPAPWLAALEFPTQPRAHIDLPPARLYEEALRRSEGVVAAGGAFVVHTGVHTGRSVNDRFIVRDALTEDKVHWGSVNKPIAPELAAGLRKKVLEYLSSRGEVFVQNASVCAAAQHRLELRVVSERAWHSLFAQNMFLDAVADAPLGHFTILHAPGCKADPATDGTRSATFIVLDFSARTVLIGGTEYAGEVKKSAFSIMNFLLPQRDVLSMHCSANVGARGDVAVLFGLSGTGKTTLSADPERSLVGDDEHGWSPTGVFNIEGGCYAKVIKLSAEAEPEIFATTRMFGTVLENVVYDAETRALDLDSEELTENTRASYTLDKIPHMVATGQGALPRNVIFLTCDAFGVLPPIARLTPAQAMYHFLSGYTAKVAGTEIGVTEPKATFSTCFGAAFMPLNPNVYARLLGERLKQANARAWLINTGWTGGAFGVGARVKIAHTRAMVKAALAGALDEVPTWHDRVFGLEVPTKVPGVPEALLRPRTQWMEPRAYDAQQRQLAQMFRENFAQYRGDVAPDVLAAEPIAP